jgi:hypothetical protein
LIDIEYAKFCDAKFLLSQSVKREDREEKVGREVERERKGEGGRERERKRE